ncbi:BZ3500_MvSof-1268-A1-R1_Chr1-3g01882 [Microbotryum saponariae]|uniref:Protein HGH1 homolog n=1 Tax=Microbotryum saponariae TaxID=289078 RepID=A0A2X0KBR0_9BASI|nr:BZ3500_MvSof-1268-A1-R1_Chr1-3g01882 [Microbotryum saponariae]SCZ94814.1 BZ3501_MvSof-1269-A2-R1_Chr1-3g01484 [Microbotryum saponariae]
MTSLQQKQQDAQLIELLGFLTDPQPQVRRIALASLLPYTAADKRERSLFNRDHYIEQIATMCADQELIAHDALSVLINLTSSIIVADRLAKIPGFLTGLVRMIIDENALLSDLACMLLSNLSKLEHLSMQLLGLRVPFNVSKFSKATDKDAEDDERPSKIVKEGETDEIEALELLLEVFLKGEGKQYNPNANYDFLASVFANVSTIPLGRSFLLSTTSPDAEPPLVKLISFTEHPSTIRRGGVASCIKNSAFQKAGHTRLVVPSNDQPPASGCIDLLPQMLLPLCGPEEFDIDVMDELPDVLQLLPDTKKREPDAAIRLILVETLVLLASTRLCREAMRKRGVYAVIRAAHLAETVDKVTEPMVRLVNLLMRDEDESTALEEVPDPLEDDKKPDHGFETAPIVGADGNEVNSYGIAESGPVPVAHAPSSVPASMKYEQVDSEDEEEMLLEV